MNADELAVHVAITADFIAGDLTSLALQRTERVRTASGGLVDGDVETLSPQNFRLVPQQDKVPETQTSNGITGHPEFVLCGMPSADLQRGDTFAWRGWTWHVSQVHTTPDYIAKADVLRGAVIR